MQPNERAAAERQLSCPFVGKARAVDFAATH